MTAYHTNSVVKHELATVPASQSSHESGQSRSEQAYGQDSRFSIAQSVPPVGAKNRNQHDSQDEMTPAGRTNANAGYDKEFYGACDTRQDTHGKSNARSPLRHAWPEGITGQPICEISTQCAKAQCNGKSHHHGVQRVTGDSNARFSLVKAAVFADRVLRINHLWLVGRRAHKASTFHKTWVSSGKRAASTLVYLSASAALVGCQGALSTLDPAGPAASMIANLWWSMLAGTAVLTALVLGLVAWSFKRTAAHTKGTKFWALGMGVVMPMAVLTVLVTAGLWMGERMQAKPASNVVTVQVQARQWAWRFVQPGKDGQAVTTDNILYIPARTPVDLQMTSSDVIHSFWVPRFAGKMDVIPGHTNVLRIEADMPGEYAGQSAEFSGVGYGEMRFTVVVYPPGEVPDMVQGRVSQHTPIDGEHS